MTLVIHISDPHFGQADPVIAQALLDEINALLPTLVVISGDLTQRARRTQFAEAREWLDRVVPTMLAVPGNHDIPLYDVARRFTSPRQRYLDYISSDLAPCFVDEELAVCGIDSTKSFTISEGRITRDQAERVAALLAPHTNHWRILVAHHPFENMSGAEDAMPLLEAAGVDLVLTGHLHLPKSEDVAMRNEAHTMVAVHAGTCISTRLRGEPNGYNQLHFTDDHVRIVHREWRDAQFVDGLEKAYRRSERAEERITKEPPTSPSRVPPPALVH